LHKGRAPREGLSLDELLFKGWASGIATDSEDTMEFSALTGVRPMIEKYPLEKAAEAYEQMISGKVRFLVVLTMGG
jgi:D-arabinose 1-dehydrogenase-like Zn-dependent alcohol dehydrogenase